NLYNKSKALQGLSTVFFDKKQYEKAILLLLESEQAALNFRNPTLLLNVKNRMISNYLILKDKKNQNIAHQEFLVLNSEYQNIEKKAVNLVYNLISLEQKQQ